jgi:membrane protein
MTNHKNTKKGPFMVVKEFVLAVGSKSAEDNLPRLASSFSFFSLLSIAPFLVLAVTVGALILGKEQTAAHLLNQASNIGGPQVREYLNSIIVSSQHRTNVVIATILSLVVTFFGASNLFLNLDDAINWIWRKKQLSSSFVKNYILTRIVAFFSVLIFGGILLGWLVLDTVIGILTHENRAFPAWDAVSFLLAAMFFSFSFSITLHALPRNQVTWRDGVPGGLVTGIGFAASKFLLTLYFQRTSGVYTAAGGIVVLLLWMYYSSIIYFIGVEMTYVYSHRFGSLRGTKDSRMELDPAKQLQIS